MNLFFQIIGIIAFSIVVAIVVAFLWLRWKIKRVFRDLEKAMDTSGGGIGPRRVHLRRIQAPASEGIEDRVRQLERLGYVRQGDYEVESLGGTRVVGLSDPSAGAMASLYDHPAVGIVCDLVIRYQDGSSLTVTNAPAGQDLDQREGHVKLFRPGAEIPDLQRLLAAERRIEPSKVWIRDEWAAGFEKAYADDMDWRLSKGISADEVRRIAEGMGGGFEDDVIDVTASSLEATRIEELTRGCLDSYLSAAAHSAAEWEALREGVHVVHEAMAADDAMVVFHELVGDDMVDEATLDAIERFEEEGLPARQLIERARGLLPEHQRFRRPGSVEHPVGADLWVRSHR